MNTPNDTIVAPATAAGGAIAVVRMSGPSALAICDTVFSGARRAGEAAGYTVLYGTIADGARVLDDVLVTVFRAPHSYTGEDAVEISCHGSSYRSKDDCTDGYRDHVKGNGQWPDVQISQWCVGHQQKDRCHQAQ